MSQLLLLRNACTLRNQYRYPIRNWVFPATAAADNRRIRKTQRPKADGTSELIHPLF